MTTRLHISPFTPDLLPAVLPPSLQSVAQDLSFHQLLTFPENNYGYVTLPTMEADKIKKKLNGSILKGKKFKVEAARPDSKHEKSEKSEKSDKKDKKEKKEKKEKKKEEKSRKRKADDHAVVEGYELPADRKVKRGWTESTEAKEERRKEEKRKRKEDKKAKAQAKSKYTEKDECLFRTQLPPNTKSDDKQAKKQKHKSSSSKEPVVVHEFANTVSHPSFLRSGADGAAPTSAFEQEKGWVDGEGHVKEPASQRATKPDYRPGKVPGVKEKRKSKSKPAKVESESEESDWTSSSGSDGESESESESESEPEPEPTPTKNKDENKDEENNDNDDESEKSESKSKDNNENEVHPLEAVFKRPTDQTQPSDNPHFSFFDADDIESDNEEEPTTTTTTTLAEPQTPFTARDMQARGLRSAAPTPDTNQVGRTIKWSNSSDNDDEMDVDGDEDDDEDDESITISTPASKSIDETEFTRWFWENRGDNNRAWKRRRREVAKEERQRENRRKGMKGKS